MPILCDMINNKMQIYNVYFTTRGDATDKMAVEK